MAVLNRKQLLTIDDFYRMVDAGVFADDERVELIQGELVEMAPIGNRHARCVMRFIDLLASSLLPRVLLNPQNPIQLDGQVSIPQPDVVLLRRRDDYYEKKPPGPEDILLLIEVADSSLKFDRDRKIPLYAQAGVAETWLADLTSGTIFAYRCPSPNGYLEVKRYRRGQEISPEAFPDQSFAVDALLGPSAD